MRLIKALAPLCRSKKKLEGTIDIYWLYDDGGLTLLLPYILSTRTKYSRNKLRIFFLSNKVEKIQEETRNMAELMAKFRYLKSMSFLKKLKLVFQELNHFCHFVHASSMGVKNAPNLYNLAVTKISSKLEIHSIYDIKSHQIWKSFNQININFH